MALSRPFFNEEHLLMGAAPLLDNNPAGGVNYIIEHPAEYGLPEVIRIVDSNEENAPIYISSDEEEGDEDEVFIVNEGEGIPPLSSDEEDEVTENEDDEETDESEDWSESEDSGYDSMYEDEEDPGDDADDGNIRPRSPVMRWYGPEDPPVPALPPVTAPAAVPQQLTVRHPQELPWQQVEPPKEPSVFPRWEECAPSVTGFSCFTKRSREESDTGQVSAKRQRWDCGDSHEESAPSVTGFSCFAKRSWGSDTEQVSAKRQRLVLEDSYEESAPSTSGLGSATNRSREESYWNTAPSTSGLGSSTHRSREESYRYSAPSTSGLGSFTNRSREESYRYSAPSTSGLGSSTNRSREESYRYSAPSTSGLASSTNRRYWPGPFEFPRWPDDRDSD